MTKKTFQRAFRDSLPIMAGYLALGIGYGVLLQSKGYSFWWAILMSCTMFAGSGQYAGVDFMAGGASLLTTAFMTLVINCRHFFYGVSLLDKYRGTGIVKPYLIFGLTDETYSITATTELGDEVDHKKYYFFLESEVSLAVATASSGFSTSTIASLTIGIRQFLLLPNSTITVSSSTARIVP